MHALVWFRAALFSTYGDFHAYFLRRGDLTQENRILVFGF